MPPRPRFTTNRAEGGYEIFLTKIPFKVPGVASLGFTSTRGTEFPGFLGFGGFIVRKWNEPNGWKRLSDSL
jgi:hypothetical protein